MRISRSSYLGVEFLARLAERSADTPCTAEELARWIERSVSYAETILARLRVAGLVKPLRGPGGGYRLAKAPDRITVAEIVRAVDDYRAADSRRDRAGRRRGASLGLASALQSALPRARHAGRYRVRLRRSGTVVGRFR